MSGKNPLAAAFRRYVSDRCRVGVQGNRDWLFEGETYSVEAGRTEKDELRISICKTGGIPRTFVVRIVEARDD